MKKERILFPVSLIEENRRRNSGVLRLDNGTPQNLFSRGRYPVPSFFRYQGQVEISYGRLNRFRDHASGQIRKRKSSATVPYLFSLPGRYLGHFFVSGFSTVTATDFFISDTPSESGGIRVQLWEKDGLRTRSYYLPGKTLPFSSRRRNQDPVKPQANLPTQKEA